MDKKRIIKKEFYNFLKQYNPLPWEEFRKDDPRFNLQKRYTNYALKNRVRFLVTLKRTVKHIAAKKLGILDLGVFPGTWLRILQEYLPSFEIKLSGAGLRAPDEFVKTMKEKFGINIFSVNLDPTNTQLKNKNYPSQLPFENETFDFISSLEIIEHLISPVNMLKEAWRVLKPGGKILITTPNVTRIGSVLKLLIGRTNYDRLAPPDYFNEEDEWRPHVYEYTMKELITLLNNSGFSIADKCFFNYIDRYFDITLARQKIIDSIKVPFYIVPHLRESILVIGQKTK